MAAPAGIVSAINTATGINPAIIGTPAATTPTPTPTPDPTAPVTPTTPSAPAGPSASDIAAFQALNASDLSTAANATGTAAQSLYGGPNGILATTNALQENQNSIDEQGVQANLARDQGLQGVNAMVNEGLTSAGVNLDNNNAASSSAADALARAYGIEGRDAASQVGNQFAQAKNAQSLAQQNQALNEQTEGGALLAQKNQSITNIIQSANAAINNLGVSAIYSQDPSLVDIAGEEAQIKANAIAQLSQYDAQLAAATNPTQMSDEAAQAKAQGLAVAGTAAAAPYTYTVAGNPQPASGPLPSALPIEA